MPKPRLTLALAGVLFAWAALASMYALYYGWQAAELQGLVRELQAKLRGVTSSVDLMIDYGNGTRVWHNGTLVPIGGSLLNATQLVARVDYSWWPAYDGAFVEAIDYVRNDKATSSFWTWWYWNATKVAWEVGPVGANKWIVRDGDVLAWYYQVVIGWPPKPPT